MKDVLVLGTAVIDITAAPIGNTSSWEEKQRIETIAAFPGGDAANQSIRLADLGCSVDICCKFGDDAIADMLSSSLEKRGVGISLVARSHSTPTTAALVLVDNYGERHTFSVKGAHRALDKDDLCKVNPSEYRAISLASLFSMPELEKDGLQDFLKMVHSLPSSNRPLVFADLGSDKKKQGIEGIRRFLPYIDYFLPSIYDAQSMAGQNDIESIARFYLEKGVSTVVIKCGADGCFCMTGENFYTVPAAAVTPVDTTGAGDTFVAYFISRILKQISLKESASFACKGASLSTLYMGASAHKITEKDILNAEI